MRKYIHNFRFVLPLVAVCILCTGCPKVTVGQATQGRIQRGFSYLSAPFPHSVGSSRKHHRISPGERRWAAAGRHQQQRMALERQLLLSLLSDGPAEVAPGSITWRHERALRLLKEMRSNSFRGIDLVSADFDYKKLTDKIIDFELSFFGKPSLDPALSLYNATDDLKGEQDWEKKVKAWGGWKATIEHWVAEGLVTRNPVTPPRQSSKPVLPF